MRLPRADTLLGEAFLRLFPGPLLYLWCLALPLSVLISAYGATHAGAVLQLLAQLLKAQVWPQCAGGRNTALLAVPATCSLHDNMLIGQLL
jgi:hypothetical protein